MSRFLFFLYFLTFTIAASAQKFEIKEKKYKLPDGTFNGYELTISGDEENIEEKLNEVIKKLYFFLQTSSIRKRL